MAKTAKKPRNRAAQDVNLINLRALKKRLVGLEARVTQLETRMIRRKRWELDLDVNQAVARLQKPAAAVKAK